MNDWFCLLCGKTFRSAIAEAKHRHNAPLLCSAKGLAKMKKLREQDEKRAEQRQERDR